MTSKDKGGCCWHRLCGHEHSHPSCPAPSGQGCGRYSREGGKINNRISPIQDDYIEKYLAEKQLNLIATLDGRDAYSDADFVVIAAPTNYDPVKNYLTLLTWRRLSISCEK